LYKVQGVMAITEQSWCDLVVWTPNSMTVERIAFDNSFWEQSKAKIVAFYLMAILPKLATPRHPHGQGYSRNYFPFMTSHNNNTILAIQYNFSLCCLIFL
jgi:hypothetical protein